MCCFNPCPQILGGWFLYHRSDFWMDNGLGGGRPNSYLSFFSTIGIRGQGNLHLKLRRFARSCLATKREGQGEERVKSVERAHFCRDDLPYFSRCFVTKMYYLQDSSGFAATVTPKHGSSSSRATLLFFKVLFNRNIAMFKKTCFQRTCFQKNKF